MCSFWLIVLIISDAIVESVWILDHQISALCKSAVAIPNNATIYLAGGISNDCPNCALFVEYNLINDTYHWDQTTITDSARVDGNWYHQAGDILYLIAGNTPWMHKFDVNGKIWMRYVMRVPIDVQDRNDRSPCVAGTDDTVFLLGGYTYTDGFVNNLQIYNISNDSWSNGPTMNYDRGASSCIVSPDTNELYVIAGAGDVSEGFWFNTRNI